MNNREIQGLANREITSIGVIEMLCAILRKVTMINFYVCLI